MTHAAAARPQPRPAPGPLPGGLAAAAFAALAALAALGLAGTAAATVLPPGAAAAAAASAPAAAGADAATAASDTATAAAAEGSATAQAPAGGAAAPSPGAAPGGTAAERSGGTPAALAGAPGAAAADRPATAGGAAAPADAGALERDDLSKGREAAVERGTETLFPFGHGRPVLRCAPLRACAVELEAGESVLATSLGDSERWLLQSAFAGPGARTPLLVVKPTACDLSTNLLVSTDRRLYEVALESPPCKGADASDASLNPRLPYTGLVRFYFPDELVRRYREREEAARREAERRGAAETPLPAEARIARLNFDYAWDRGRRLPWNPLQVFDDGERTYVALPPESRQADLPLLFAVEAGGRLTLINYRLLGRTLVADRVVERAVLVVGAPGARGAQRLDLVNRAYPRKGGS
jgi:P-type conjugative transfer protein TrbG